MKKVFVLLSLSVMTIAMVQCSPKKGAKTAETATPTEKTDDEKIAELKKNYTEAQMEEGKAIFQEHCNKCHGYHEPETRTLGKWEHVLPRMINKAKLNEEQGGKITAYVYTHAKTS